MAISQASGAEVDGFAAFWLACSVALILRVRRTGVKATRVTTAVALGCACGLAFVTKATNGLFLIPFVVWSVAGLARRNQLRLIGLGLLAIFMALAINSGQMRRNFAYYNRVLGPKAKGGTVNDTFGPRVLASNVVRNASLQFTSRSSVMTRLVYDAVKRAHDVIGIGIDDPRTTYVRKFSVLPKREDEGVANEPIHLVILAIVFLALLFRKPRDPVTAVLACLVAGFLIYCGYLKWQPWNARMHLPLLVVSAGAAAVILERIRPRTLKWMSVLLFVTAFPVMFRESLRPLVARHNVLNTPWEKRLFIDSYGAHDAYLGAAEFLVSRGCLKVGLIETEITHEYPFWYILGHRAGKPIEIRHYGVFNNTWGAVSRQQKNFAPCAIVSIFFGAPDFPVYPPGFTRVWKQGKVTVYMRG
jgi:hypothetical protein